MNKLIKALIFTISFTFLLGCASNVKLKKSWKSDDFNTVKNNKILVVNKSKSEAIRQRGEREITNALKEKGMNAVEAFVAFPHISVANGRSEAELEKVIDQILAAGYKSVVITKLINPEKYGSGKTRLTEDDQKDETATYYDTSSYGKYPMTFGVYFNNPNDIVPNRTPGPNGMEETTENFSEVFLLETLTYNIEKKSEQLLSSVSIEITDPENVMDVLKRYAALVSKQFE